MTKENYRDVLTPLLTEGGGRGFCVNVSVDTSSRAIMELCRELGAFYIDTVAEPWPGFYFDKNKSQGDRTNYALRQEILDARAANPGGTTAVSCCGANPGMVSWFVKQGLLNVACDLGLEIPEPKDRAGWASLMREVGVKGIHIAERDTQRANTPKPQGVFVNTWSVEGFVSEGNQPAELGWGTHETWRPDNARDQEKGSRCAIYLLQPGADTRVRSWTPTAQSTVRLPRDPQRGRLDLGLLHGVGGRARRLSADLPLRLSSRPATRCCRFTRCSARRPRCKRNTISSTKPRSSTESTSSAYSSTATPRTPTGSARSFPLRRPGASLPYQNATGLAGDLGRARRHGLGTWRTRRPASSRLTRWTSAAASKCRCPYLGPVVGVYTDWTPLAGRPGLFPEDIDETDPWQFRNVLVR